jgi:hypothetical protein
MGQSHPLIVIVGRSLDDIYGRRSKSLFLDQRHIRISCAKRICGSPAAIDRDKGANLFELELNKLATTYAMTGLAIGSASTSSTSRVCGLDADKRPWLF